MDYLFSTPVFIKPLGIIAAPEQIGKSLSLHLNMVRNYSLAEQTNLNEPLMVKSEAVITVSASFILSNGVFALKDGAKLYNATQRENAEAIVTANQAVVAEPPKRGRGRRAKVVEVPEDDEAVEDATEALIASHITDRAVDIAFFELRIEERSVPLEDSEPYRLRTEGKEKNEAAFSNAIALINSLNKKIGGLRATLSAPSAQDMAAATGSLIPDFSQDEVAIDRQGVENYESSLRNQITAGEERVRERVRFLKEKVIDVVNDQAHHTVRPFTGDAKFGNESITQAEVLKLLKEELFIPVAL